MCDATSRGDTIFRRRLGLFLIRRHPVSTRHARRGSSGAGLSGGGGTKKKAAGVINTKDIFPGLISQKTLAALQQIMHERGVLVLLPHLQLDLVLRCLPALVVGNHL